MKEIYEQKIKVLASQTDINVEMGLTQSMAIIQDNMCEYFKYLNCDGPTIIPDYNCFFVLTKSKVHFNKFAKWLDEFNLTTKITNVSRIAVTLETSFEDIQTGEKFATCKQELCAMDNTTRKLRMVSDTPFPMDLGMSEIREKSFTRFNVEFEEKDKVKTIQIDAANIDLYRHTNNVEYIRFMMSTFDKDYMLENRVTDYEIHYVSESKFGEVLDIYRKEIDGVIYFEIKCEDRIVTRAMMNCEKR